MGGVTTKGYPYPTGADRVADGDNAMQSLAQAIDVRSIQHRGHGTNADSAGAGTAQPSLPSTLLIITGRVTVAFPGGGSGAGAFVTFPGGGFPNAVLSISFSTYYNVANPLLNGTTGLTKAGFQPYCVPFGGLAANMDIIYTAIGY